MASCGDFSRAIGSSRGQSGRRRRAHLAAALCSAGLVEPASAGTAAAAPAQPQGRAVGWAPEFPFPTSFRGAAPVRGLTLALGTRRRRAAAGGKLGPRCGAASAPAAGAALSAPGRAARGLMGAGRCPTAGGARGLRKESPGRGRRVTPCRCGHLCPLRGHSRAVTPGIRTVTVGNGGCVPCLGEYGLRREGFPLSQVTPYCRQGSRGL